MLQYRMRCAWGKFSQFRRALIDKHVDLRLRLRLFGAVVTPSAMYGLSVAPLTIADKNYINGLPGMISQALRFGLPHLLFVCLDPETLDAAQALVRQVLRHFS